MAMPFLVTRTSMWLTLEHSFPITPA
eukprot:COSAG02_NODE_2276_length_9242_cov_933.673411_8_plen_25_part_01